MSLKDFHIVFITASVLLALGFAVWGFVQYHPGSFLLSLLAAAGLVVYEIRFIRKTKGYNDR